MSHPVRLIVVLYGLVAAAGCQNSLRNVAKATTGNLQAPSVPPLDSGTVTASATSPAPPLPGASPTLSTAMTGEPLIEPTREQAFQQILSDLQEIGRQSPTAQQELLAQLETADPAHWSPLVQRARSTMMYQQQIATRQSRANVLPASTEQPAAPSDHGHDHQPKVIQLSTPDSSPPPDHGAYQSPPSVSDLPLAAASATTGDTAMHDSAVMPATAMIFPGPADADQSPYPVTPYPAPSTAATPASGGKDPLRQAIDHLTAKLDERPQSMTEAYDHVRLRLLQLAAGDLDSAAEPPPGLTTGEQQYWSNQLLAVSTMLDHRAQPETRRRAAAAGMHMDRASSAIEQLGSLTVSNLAFCKQVYGFGTYDKVESAKFVPGQEVRVYLETRNYKSIDTPQGVHSSLSTSYRVLDQHGGRVDEGEAPVVNDYCATRRNDFHIQYVISLPKGIYPGEYLLEFTLTDQLGDKIGHGQLEFEIIEGKSP